MANNEEQPQLTEAQWRAQFEANMAKWRADVEFIQTSFEATITFASTTIRSLLILNGAAAIAILTFVGDQSKSVPGFNVQPWLPAFEVFGWGTFLAVACSALSYLAQLFFTPSTDGKPKMYAGRTMQLLAISAGITSLLAFICGLYRSMAALG